MPLKKEISFIGSAFLAILLSAGIFFEVPFLFAFDTAFNAEAFSFQQESPLAVFFSYFTELASVELMVTVSITFLLLFLIKKQWKDALFLVVLFAGGNGFLHLLLKPFFDRPRPEGIMIIEHDASFPSGHTFAAVLLVALLFFSLRALKKLSSPCSQCIFWGISVVYILGVLLSRLVLHAHFVSDVLASVCWGIAWSAGITLLFSNLFEREKTRVSLKKEQILSPHKDQS